MPTPEISRILEQHHELLLQEWMKLQLGTLSRRPSAQDEATLEANSREFLALFRAGMLSGNSKDINTGAWAPVREFLTSLSASRVKEGFGPSETAMFIFSLKEPIFDRLRKDITDAGKLADEMWITSLILDKLGLLTTEAFQRMREDVISRQQRELLELSTPVVRLWENILALPLIGTLDSERTQVVMENLLEAIVSTRSDIAIIDITGVPTVDTLVAQHLLKTVAAARLMGADCIISGVRPQIAQTIIHLGVDLSAVVTKATLAGALQVALQRTGATIVKGAASR